MNVNKSLKTIGDTVKSHLENGVSNLEQLRAALPSLVDLVEAIKHHRSLIASLDKMAKDLNTKCTAYATKHQSCFDDRQMHTSQLGVLTGDITIDEMTYHLACGYDGYIRADGDKLTQAFLMDLPENWRKEKLELNTTGINDAKVSDEELEKFGLTPKSVNTWSRKEV